MIIDVSKYQSKVDWIKVKNQIEGAYIKATEGVGFIDPMFTINAANSINAGVPVGFYHFATLNSKDVIKDSAAEAKSFYDSIKDFKFTLPCVLDIEKNDIGLSPDEVLKWIQNFVLTMHLYGVNDVILYSYAPFLDSNLPKNHQLGTVMKLWIAAYTDKLKLPNGWKDYWLWQYSSKGKIDGIVGFVDLNKK